MRATALLLLASCATPPAPTSEMTYPRHFDDAWIAVADAIADLGLTVDVQERGASAGRLDARSAKGETVTVRVKGADAERVTVSVDCYDSFLASLLLERISTRLGTRHATSAGSPSTARTR